MDDYIFDTALLCVQSCDTDPAARITGSKRSASCLALCVFTSHLSPASALYTYTRTDPNSNHMHSAELRGANSNHITYPARAAR